MQDPTVSADPSNPCFDRSASDRSGIDRGLRSHFRTCASSLVRVPLVALFLAAGPLADGEPKWVNLSSSRGDLPLPSESVMQTGAVVADFDGDGLQDFILAFRQKAPALVGCRRTPSGWERSIVEGDNLTVEAGGAVADIDGDGDLDLLNKPYTWKTPCVDGWLQGGTSRGRRTGCKRSREVAEIPR
jgi:hypothetical protein